MKPFRYVLKSLFNNTVIIEGRKRKWLESFIVFIIAMIIALVPTIVTIASVQGSAIIDANSNGVDEALRTFSEDMNKNNIKFTIKEENKTKIIVATLDDVTKLENWDTKGNYYSYKRYDDDKLVERLRVYLSLDLDNDAISKQVTTLQEQDIKKVAVSSFLIIGKEASYLCLYSKAAESWSSPSATRFLTYDRFDNGKTVISSYIGEHSIDNWKEFIDRSYTSTKIASLFTQIGIYASINVIVSLFMSLMIFIVTRGKNNPYRDYKFVEALKIVGIASLTPSIISALVGFILPSFASMLFMVTLGIRIMWLTSRNLNPAIRN